jgi:hypothetical protein
VGVITRHSKVRRTLLTLAPAALAARFLPAQAENPQDKFPPPAAPDEPNRLPNGKLQRDEILKADYQQNLKDARELIDLSKSFELDLEKSDRFVLSLGLLKKLDEMEKITKRIRGRMRH